jgi:hypothetical protein
MLSGNAHLSIKAIEACLDLMPYRSDHRQYGIVAAKRKSLSAQIKPRASKFALAAGNTRNVRIFELVMWRCLTLAV